MPYRGEFHIIFSTLRDSFSALSVCIGYVTSRGLPVFAALFLQSKDHRWGFYISPVGAPLSSSPWEIFLKSPPPALGCDSLVQINLWGIFRASRC